MSSFFGTSFGSSPRQRPIRSPEKRVHLPLNLTATTRAVLSQAALALETTGAWERAGIHASARLVELSCMIVFPGATAQAPHTDVPPDTSQRMGTCWIGLQDTDPSMAPTMIFPAAPNDVASQHNWRAILHHAEAPARGATYYDSQGEQQELENLSLTPPTLNDLGLPPAEAVCLDTGDLCLMDCRVFHNGSAHTGREPRALLSATFEQGLVECASSAGESGPTGFTYELRSDLAGRFLLSDFL